MTPRFLLSLLFLGLMVKSQAAPKEGGEVFLGKDLDLVSAEFGLVEQDADGTVHIKATDKIPLVAGQTYGWRLRFKTKREIVALREEFEVPVAPKSWASSIPDAAFKVSPDGRTGITEADGVLVDGALMNAWQVAERDPPGAHVIRLYIERRLVRTFKFEVVAK